MKNRRKAGDSTNEEKLTLGILVILLLLLTITGCQIQIARYLVSYEVDGAIYRYQMVNGDDKAVPPSVAPGKYGYVFSCWSLDGRNAFDFNTGINRDIELVALWNEKTKYTVTFSYGDGLTPDSSINVYEGEEATVPDDPVREGWKFTGWIDNDGNAFDFSTPVKGDMTLTASWKKQCTVTFTYGDGSTPDSSIKVYEGEEAAAPDNPVRGGWRFLGWLDGDGNTFDFSTPVKGDMTLTASWEKKTLYLVEFYENKASEEAYTIMEVYDGDVVSAPVVNPTGEGATFICWTDENGKTYDFSAPVTSPLKLYGKWNYRDKLTVTYHLYYQNPSDTKSEVTTKVVAYRGDRLEKPADPVRYGYKFIRWVWDSPRDSEVDFGTTTVVGNFNIYAEWEEKTKCKVTFDYNGSGKASDTKTVYEGTVIAQPDDPTYDKFYFVKWIGEDDKEFDFDEPITSDTTITAVWSEAPIYDITFDHDNGTEDTVIRLDENSDHKVPRPEDPEREGLVFKCWTLDGEEFDFDTVVSSDLTLKASWKLKDSYSIHDIGPGGGYVFYDKGEYSDGWRYMEVARSSIGYYKFGFYRTDDGENKKVGTFNEIGTGKSNTEKIVAAMGDEAYMDKEGDEKAGYAVLSCYKKDLFNNGYDDWFLPSKDELYQIYINLHIRWNVDWGHDTFYSSSEYDENYAWSQEFFFGYQHGYIRSVGQYILPVRQF